MTSHSIVTKAANKRFRLACRMLRKSGKLDITLPGARPNESPVDWLVRIGLAPSPAVAAEMLVLGFGLTDLLDELEKMPETEGL